MTKPWLGRDLVAEASSHLDVGCAQYFFGAADREFLMHRNYRAWHRYALEPKYLDRPKQVTTSAKFGSRALATPLTIAPIAFQSLLDPTGEPGLAFAAGVGGVGYTISTRSSRRLSAIAEAFALGQQLAPEEIVGLDEHHRALIEPWQHERRGELWLQVYQTENPEFTTQLIKGATGFGVRAGALTIDTPHLGARYHDQRNNFSPMDALRHVLDPVDQDGPAFGDGFSPAEIEQSRDLDFGRFIAECDAAGLDPIAKGILSLHDLGVIRQARPGRDPIIPWVSNHGGRQSDLVTTTAEALARFAPQSRQDTVIVDGGIADPTDALVAIALGAKVVALGRPVMAAFALGGVLGAMQYLIEFRDQLLSQLTILGYASPDALATGSSIRMRTVGDDG
jgi:isopentenyl diphosphate isomerase/L-lactate dehydrogenase-like FMN-dependent dehydrogenase